MFRVNQVVSAWVNNENDCLLYSLHHVRAWVLKPMGHVLRTNMHEIINMQFYISHTVGLYSKY